MKQKSKLGFVIVGSVVTLTTMLLLARPKKAEANQLYVDWCYAICPDNVNGTLGTWLAFQGGGGIYDEKKPPQSCILACPASPGP